MGCKPSTVIGGVATALAVDCIVFFSLHRGQLALRWGVTAGAAVASGVLAALVLRCINNQPRKEATKPIKATVLWQGPKAEVNATARSIMHQLHIADTPISHLDEVFKNDPVTPATAPNFCLYFYPYHNPRSFDCDRLQLNGLRHQLGAVPIFVVFIATNKLVLENRPPEAHIYCVQNDETPSKVDASVQEVVSQIQEVLTAA